MKTFCWFGVIGTLLLTVGLSVALAEGPAEKKEESSVNKAVTKKVDKEETFEALCKMRSVLLSETKKLEQEIPNLLRKKSEFSFSLDRKKNYENQIKGDEAQLAGRRMALEIAGPAEKKALQEQVKKLEDLLIFEREQLQSIIEKIDFGGGEAKIKQLFVDLETKQNDLTTSQNDLETVERLISDRLNVIRPKQNFKTNMSIIFAVLVAIVIVGFFAIAYYDESVRRTIFSGTAGIQFVTLFSVVIAIILFGIIEILEGRELAALLGGLSGYILGRATSEEKKP